MAAQQDDNVRTVLTAFDTLFNKRDYAAAERLWSASYMLAEHWDVIQDEATRQQSQSGLPMFGDSFPA
jgi:predicted SnoaL-like aldol condensation-catalyzing enzyme